MYDVTAMRWEKSQFLRYWCNFTFSLFSLVLSDLTHLFLAKTYWLQTTFVSFTCVHIRALKINLIYTHDDFSYTKKKKETCKRGEKRNQSEKEGMFLTSFWCVCKSSFFPRNIKMKFIERIFIRFHVAFEYIFMAWLINNGTEIIHTSLFTV